MSKYSVDLGDKEHSLDLKTAQRITTGIVDALIALGETIHLVEIINVYGDYFENGKWLYAKIRIKTKSIHEDDKCEDSFSVFLKDFLGEGLLEKEVRNKILEKLKAMFTWKADQLTLRSKTLSGLSDSVKVPE